MYKISLTPDDFGTLAVCAIRYCQGRQTYMPSLVRGIIEPHLEQMGDRDLTVMLNDCEYQDKNCLYGNEAIDKPGWIAWRRKLEAVLKARQGEK